MDLDTSDVGRARRQIELEFRVNSDVIVSPGKFERGPVWAPYYWALALEGGGEETIDNGSGEDDATCTIDYFKPSQEERDTFPTIGKAKWIAVWSDDAGFVHAVGCDLPEAHAANYFGDGGYTDCACRDCFEIAIGKRGRALCSDCEESGCSTAGDSECSAEGAYGFED